MRVGLKSLSGRVHTHISKRSDLSSGALRRGIYSGRQKRLHTQPLSLPATDFCHWKNSTF